MLHMRCPTGLFVTPDAIVVYRDTYTAHSEKSVERVGLFPAPKTWTVFKVPHHGSELRSARDTHLEARFEETVKSWLEQVRDSPSDYLKEFPKEKIPAGTRYAPGTIIEKLKVVLDEMKIFMSAKTNNGLKQEIAEKNYRTLSDEAATILEDIEDTQTNNSTSGKIDIPTSAYDLLLGEAKRLLQELISFTKDEFSESGQKILHEIQHTHFLNKLQQPISEIAANASNKFINSDSLALKIQLTSQHFYMYLWSSLTKEEKFILYDLAEDGLVNTCDTLNLTMLISKGLIQRDGEGTLRVFNKSFRNFIITSIGYTESNKIKKEIKQNGNWNRWRTPLVIIILGIFSLLITSQQEVYTKVIGYLTVLVTAVIPLLQRLFALFEKGDTKS